MFKPFIEVENECVLLPNANLIGIVNCWNNSPKLMNSNVDFENRYKPDVINYTSQLDNSWFKFVISNEADWNEIDVAFLMPELIKKCQIILMPQGATREELERNRETVISIAIENNVRYTSREHIILWNKKVGV